MSFNVRIQVTQRNMANAGAQFMDSVNNNTMSNNNNSSNINNNTSFSPSLVATDRLENSNILRDVIVIGAEHAGAATIADVISNRNRNNSSGRTRNSSRDCNNGNTSSRRSRSRGRSRSSHRRSHSSHRNSRHHSRLRHKQQERNFPAALCSMITIVVISTALAEPRWIRIDSGSCSLIQAGLLNYLGAFQFFYNGHFIERDSSEQNKHTITDYQFGPGVEDRMVNCVTDRGILLFKTVIALTFLAIVCSLCAFLLDLIGPSQRFLKLLRRSAIFDIITVFLCIVVTLLMYWISVIVMALQEQATQEGAPVISFDVSFYLITAAGITSVFAVACNCLRRYPFTENDSPPARAILDDQFNDDTENLLSLPPPIFHVQELPSLSNLPPPPPYTP